MLYDVEIKIKTATGDTTDSVEQIRQTLGDMMLATLNTIGIPHEVIEVDVKPRRFLEVVDRFTNPLTDS